MAKRKPTVGEKEADSACAKCPTCRLCPYGRNTLARRIDRVVRQAFRDGKMYGPYAAGTYTGDRAVYLKVCAKYGVKP